MVYNNARVTNAQCTALGAGFLVIRLMTRRFDRLFRVGPTAERVRHREVGRWVSGFYEWMGSEGSKKKKKRWPMVGTVSFQPSHHYKLY